MVLSVLGGAISNTLGFVSRHPRAILLVVVALLGWLVGSALARVALLSNPMRTLVTLLYPVVMCAAVAAGERDPSLGRRVGVAVLAASVGLLGFRLIGDALGVGQTELRSDVTGVMALLSGATGFIKTRARANRSL